MAPSAFNLLSEGKVQPAIKPSLPSCVLLHSDDDVRNSRDPSLSSLSPRALLYEVHKVNVFLDTLPCHLDSATASVHGETLQTSYVVATFLSLPLLADLRDPPRGASILPLKLQLHSCGLGPSRFC